jgi:hypothetical protein
MERKREPSKRQTIHATINPGSEITGLRRSVRPITAGATLSSIDFGSSVLSSSGASVNTTGLLVGLPMAEFGAEMENRERRGYFQNEYRLLGSGTVGSGDGIT